MIRFSLFGEGDNADEPQSSASSQGDAAARPAPLSAAHPLDAVTGGAFSAATSGERAARVRAWLATDPDQTLMHEVFKELSARDKGAAKALREKLDEIRRSKGQEAMAAEWAAKAEQLLQGKRLNIADAMAWQRDAAKAGAPLSKEPLAAMKQQLAERIKGIEDLQTRVQVQREAAVLLAQRVEVLSTKSWKEADAVHQGLLGDVTHWREQANVLTADTNWGSVDAKYAAQLDASRQQLQLVVQAFEDALTQTKAAVEDSGMPLPPVPVWADEVRVLRGETVTQEVADPQAQAAAAEKAAALQQRRAVAEAAVSESMALLEKELVSGHSKASLAAAQALRQQIKEHRKLLSAELEGRAHAVLASAGELEGWQRWRADQIRQELVQQAEALIQQPATAAAPAVAEAPETAADGETGEVPVSGGQQAEAVAAAEATPAAGEVPTQQGPEMPVEQPAGAQRPLPASKLSPRKLQDTLRQLREQWKQTDQGGMPNHALWKRFDHACNEAYRIVDAWLTGMKESAAEHKAVRLALLEELRQWGEQLAADAGAGSADWKAAHRTLAHFGKRWREAGHLSEKVFAELQPRWKAALSQAGAPLDAAQKASMAARHAMIDEAVALGEAPALRMDAVKALQQRWQQEAHNVPLDRRQEQKLWDAFRKPIDEAFQRKSQQRQQAQAALTAHDQQVMDAARALEAANAKGDAQAIQQAMQALESAIRGAQDGQEKALPASPEPQSAPAADHPPGADGDGEAAPRAPAASASVHRPAIAVRGDDRPQPGKPIMGKGASMPDRRDGRPGGRSPLHGKDAGRGGERTDRAPRGPRMGDAAFRAQRDALDHAQAALRKLATQAHGETITRMLDAWQQRQADALPSTAEWGKAVSGQQRNAWLAALSAAPQAGAKEAMLRLEMAAEVPTPAEHLADRRALQLQLLTRRNDPSPRQTWAEDVGKVLAAAHDAGTARRLQQVLKTLLR